MYPVAPKAIIHANIISPLPQCLSTFDRRDVLAIRNGQRSLERNCVDRRTSSSQPGTKSTSILALRNVLQSQRAQSPSVLRGVDVAGSSVTFAAILEREFITNSARVFAKFSTSQKRDYDFVAGLLFFFFLTARFGIRRSFLVLDTVRDVRVTRFESSGNAIALFVTGEHKSN